jgi:hypothetical protein
MYLLVITRILPNEVRWTGWRVGIKLGWIRTKVVRCVAYLNVRWRNVKNPIQPDKLGTHGFTGDFFTDAFMLEREPNLAQGRRNLVYNSSKPDKREHIRLPSYCFSFLQNYFFFLQHVQRFCALYKHGYGNLDI